MQYSGAIYHVMSRGDRRERIFLDDQDRRKFLETLELAMDRRLFGDGRGGLRCGVCPRVAQAIVRRFRKICESAGPAPSRPSESAKDARY